MADWNSPTLLTDYDLVLDDLMDRDVDAATLFASNPTNPPTSAVRYNRGTNKFQEWDGATWVDMDVASGLGLGTMSSQDSNAVAITGGTIGGTVDIDASRLTSGLIPTPRQVYPLIGAGFMWFLNTAPDSKHILLQGQNISRSTYADLFSLWGTTYGSGDGSTTFGVPDLRQRFPLGKAASGTGVTLGSTGGAIDHTHTGPSHTHDYTDVPAHTHTITDPGHTHDVTVVAAIGGSSKEIERVPDASATETLSDKAQSKVTGITVNSAGVATGTTQAAGTGATGATNPPFFVVNFAIRALP